MNISMHVKRSVLVIAATLGLAFAAGTVVAADHTVTVAIHVSTQGLDLSQPAGARTLYERIENAAWVACTRGNRADLVPVDNLKSCYENSLAAAVRSVRRSEVTRMYMARHTLEEAAAHGIEEVMASK